MIQSIDRAARILALLQGARRLGVTELATSLELSPSTVHGLVKALQVHGLVAQEAGGSRYMLGPALLKLSSVYLDTLDVRARAMRWTRDLSLRTGYATRLGVIVPGDVLIVHHDGRPDGIEQMPETGLTVPAHATSLGKVLMAYDDDFASEILSRELVDLTDATVTDRTELRAQLDDVRTVALATEVEEAVIGDVSAAVPIVGETGHVVAALGLVLHAEQWPMGESTLRDLRESARVISRELGAQSWPPRRP